MESVPPEGTLSRILMGTIQIDLEICSVVELVKSFEGIPTDANASGIFSGQASTHPICMRTSAYSTYNARMRTLMSQGFAENGAVVARPSTPVAA